MNKAVEKATEVATKKKEYPRNRNLFEVTKTFQNFAVGEKLTRSIWRRPDCYWTVTKLTPTILNPNLKPRGKAWGVLTWRGIPEGVERKIRGSNKKEWKLYDPKWFEQFKNQDKWIQNQHLIGGAPAMPIVLQDPTKVPLLESRYRTVHPDQEEYEEAIKKSKEKDQKILFKSPESDLVFYYPFKKSKQ